MSDASSALPLALVVDDEPQMRRLLKIALEGNGYRVVEAVCGQDGLTEAATRRPDVVLLDLGLPDLDGVTVLRRIREWSSVPVVVLTVRDSDDDKIAALDGGADDYLTKPFSTPELLARLRALQRRSTHGEEKTVFKAGGLVVDLGGRTVTRDGGDVKLTATEYALLALLVRHAGKILTHRHILREVWGPNAEEHRQYLRVYMTHLRKKIEVDPAAPKLLRTESGIGYRLMC
jgi:two-component system, OmpR family, KDP operon response regulator KdpE